MKKVIFILIILLFLPFSIHSAVEPPVGLTTAKVLKAIDKNYLEPEKIIPSELLNGALEYLQNKIPEFKAQYLPTEVNAEFGYSMKKFKIKEDMNLQDLSLLMLDIYSFIRSNKLDDIKPQEVEHIAIAGMLSKLDPHSNFLTPKIYKEFKVDTKGEFGGVGMVIGVKEGQLTVIAPLEGTPAYEAGIKAGDRIVQIGNESTINISVTEAVNLLRGEKGTFVTVIVERGTQNKRFTMRLKRSIIHVDSVQSKLIELNDGKKIGYIKIKNFQGNTDEDFTIALKNLKTSGTITGLILDLRNNPGGLLDQAAKITDHFITSGTIVSTKAAGGILLDEENAKTENTEPNYPIVVIINEGSASASEIVAKTLQRYKRALVMGQNSFGKGSVQTVFEFPPDTALKLTIAKYMAAGEIPIQPYGITPDIELIPVEISKDNVDMIPNVKISEDLIFNKDKKLNEENIPKAIYRVSYIDNPPKDKDELIEKRSKEQYSKIPSLKDDFAVELATKIVAEGSIPIDKILAQVSRDEEMKFQERLKGINVEWSRDEKKCAITPKIDFTFAIKKENKPVNSAVAGEESDFEITVVNKGTEPICNLIANTSSKNPVLTELEFPVGNIKPGEKKSWVKKIKIPESSPMQSSAIDFSFLQDNKQKIAHKAKAVVEIVPSKKPKFSFSYRIKGKVPAKSIDINKSLLISTTIKNIGDGSSSDQAAVAISAEEVGSIFINKGRLSITPMKPGEKKTVDLEFRLQPGFENKLVEMNLAIFDSKNLVGSEQLIKISPKTGSISPLENVTYIAPTIKFNPAAMIVDKAQASISGTITDDKAIKDYYLYVGEKKVFYKALAEETNKAEFKIDIVLEKDNNLITIIARDKNNLSASESVIINYNAVQ